MKKRISYLIISLSLMLSGVLMPAVAHAVVDGNSSSGSSGSASTTSTTSDDDGDDVADDSAGRPARLDDYKKQLKEALTAVAKTRITGRCKAAQVIVKAKRQHNTTVTSKRTTSYDAIINKLEALSSALEAKNIDATTLKANIEVLKTKITTFETDNKAYQQTLTDLETLDCTADPTAFKAALEAARTAQAKVLKDALEIRTYINTTLKPTLQALKTAANSDTNSTDNQ